MLEKKTARAVVAGCDHWRIVGYCDVCVMSVAVVAWCPTVAPNCDEKCRTSTPLGHLPLDSNSGWTRGVALASFGVATKLHYAGPG